MRFRRDEEHVGALALELAGTVDKPLLRRLLSEARSLCDATSKLPRTGEAAHLDVARAALRGVRAR